VSALSADSDAGGELASGPDTDVRLRYVSADGLRLRTSVRGTGRPLLILSGIGASLELSVPFERAIHPYGVQTITLDAPGTGESDHYPGMRRMPALARTVAAVLDELGYDRVDVLGLSFGGMLAQQFAHTARARVRRLVLVATVPGVAGLGGVPGSPNVIRIMATPHRYTSPAYHRQVAGELYGGEARRDPAAHLDGSGWFERPPSRRGYLAQLYALTGWTALPWLWRLTAPTLVLAGDDDPIVPLVNGRILAQAIPRARLEVVRGGGHLFLLERPQETAASVAHFLAG
jgi:poly(3-hydroxyalkanoate) depolymerase